MKILHTSDWHIGHQVSGIDRYDEYELFFDWLRDIINKENIELLIISGDIFDVYNPSNKALEQYYDFLATLKIKTVIIGGNHDSPKTLEAPKEVLKHINVDVISGGRENYKKIIEFDDFTLLAVSYLRENILGPDLLESIKEIYKISSKKPVIATGHMSVYGASLGGGEREIYIGKIEAVPSTLFEDFNYTALGHIHKYQKIKENIVYSGSPLQMAFDENYDKKIVIIDTEDFQTKTVTVPKFRKFIKLKGTFEEIYEEIKKHNSYELKPFAEIELRDNSSSEDIQALKEAADFHILKIKLPLILSQNSGLDIKAMNFDEIIKNIFENDEDLDEIIKIINEIKTEIKEEK